VNRLLIRGGRVIDPINDRDGLFDIYVIGEKIAAVKPPIPPVPPLEKGGI